MSIYWPKGMPLPKAFSANSKPFTDPGCKASGGRHNRTASAVRVHTNPESMAGPSIAMSPSRTGWSLADLPCMIDAVPIPASLTSAARRAPIMAMPINAPQPASRENASVKMDENTAPTLWILVRMMYNTIRKYAATMNGTTTVATRLMRLIPPSTTAATRAAMAMPVNSRA